MGSLRSLCALLHIKVWLIVDNVYLRTLLLQLLYPTEHGSSRESLTRYSVSSVSGNNSHHIALRVMRLSNNCDLQLVLKYAVTAIYNVYLHPLSKCEFTLFQNALKVVQI